MRLRYLYLPDYGPLKDVAVIFGQNHHIENRQGSVNFVVGLNGSGKSSLLRAIYDVFHCLAQEELPKFPVTLVYEIIQGAQRVPVIFHRPLGPASAAFLRAVPFQFKYLTREEWQRTIKRFTPTGSTESLGFFVAGDRLKGDGNLRTLLPNRVLAYTSGDLAPWQAMTYPNFPADELIDDPNDFDPEQERPQGWTPEREYLEARTNKTKSSEKSKSDDTTPPFNDRCLLLTPNDVRLAAIALGIWQAALELEERPEVAEQQALRRGLLEAIDSGTGAKESDPARRLLNELDWLWPTHASFLLSKYDTGEEHSAVAPAHCYWLHALADAVIRHPLDHSLSVVALGHRPPIRPEELAGDETLEELLKIAGEPLRNARCGAEALRRLFAGEEEAHASLWGIFHTLRGWHSVGLLKDVQLTVKRIRQVPDLNGQLDDCVISFTSFSDGEQMLLGRMALLLLLQRQDNTLLLLDEPETHFNDAWKRQIIDLVDESILKSTAAHVLVSTHTSLALTDVFACEITRLTKEKGVTTAQPVRQPTFGADPGRILLHVFGAPDVIGARAAEFLRSKLDPAKWPAEDREKLRALIEEIGSGWPRAKLMEILYQLDNPDAAPGP